MNPKITREFYRNSRILRVDMNSNLGSLIRIYGDCIGHTETSAGCCTRIEVLCGLMIDFYFCGKSPKPAAYYEDLPADKLAEYESRARAIRQNFTWQGAGDLCTDIYNACFER